MKYFTASNDVAISMSPEGDLAATPKDDTGGDSTVLLPPMYTDALREFFLDEDRERFPFPPVRGVSRDPLPTMTRPSRGERFLTRVTPERLYRPSRLDQKDGIR